MGEGCQVAARDGPKRRVTVAIAMERHHVHMGEGTQEDLVARLRSVEGHVRGVQRMVEGDDYCMDIIRQTLAVQRALDKVNGMLLENHLAECVTSAIRSDVAQDRERVLGEILEVFETSRKL